MLQISQGNLYRTVSGTKAPRSQVSSDCKEQGSGPQREVDWGTTLALGTVEGGPSEDMRIKQVVPVMEREQPRAAFQIQRGKVMLWKQCQGAPPSLECGRTLPVTVSKYRGQQRVLPSPRLGVAKQRCNELWVFHRSESHEQWPSCHCNTCCLLSIILNLCLQFRIF